MTSSSPPAKRRRPPRPSTGKPPCSRSTASATLEPEQLSLALYWRQEEARRRPGDMAADLGTEYHAYDVGDTVGAFVRTRLAG